jgi:hypothetical protein
VCTVHNTERDCVYSAQCSERLCVQCTVQSEIVCTVLRAVSDFVYSAQCRARLCEVHSAE